jgi:hypothetical protein
MLGDIFGTIHMTIPTIKMFMKSQINDEVYYKVRKKIVTKYEFRKTETKIQDEVWYQTWHGFVYDTYNQLDKEIMENNDKN